MMSVTSSFRRIITARFVAGLVVGVDLHAAAGVGAQSEVQNALIDAAKLLYREVAIVDVFRTTARAIVRFVAQSENRVRDDASGKLRALEDRRRCALEQTAIVGRYAQRIVAIGDRAKIDASLGQ